MMVFNTIGVLFANWNRAIIFQAQCIKEIHILYVHCLFIVSPRCFSDDSEDNQKVFSDTLQQTLNSLAENTDNLEVSKNDLP